VKEAGAAYGIVPSAPSDIERVESGLLSYGADARYSVNPFEAGLDAFVHLDRKDDFVGKSALQRIAKEGVRRRRVGFVIGGDRINGITEWSNVYLGQDVVGAMTEVVYSPRLKKNIAVGMVGTGIVDDEQALETTIGNQRRPVKLCRLPFC